MADTERTVREIEEALVRRAGDIRQIIAVPNVTSASFLLDHEADLLVLTKAGYCTEYEIKRSWADFKADFKKETDHSSPIVYRFAYVVPACIEEKVKGFLAEKYKADYAEFSRAGKHPALIFNPAVLVYDEQLNIRKTDWSGPYLMPTGRKMFLEEQLHLARLASIRYWAMRDESQKLLNVTLF